MRALATIAMVVAGVTFLSAGLGFGLMSGLGGGATNLLLAAGLVSVGGTLLMGARSAGQREQKPPGARRAAQARPAAAPRPQQAQVSEQHQVLADPATPRPERGGPTQPPPVQIL